MKIYCYNCGTKLQTRPIQAYNEETGEQLSDPFCPNLNCRVGCGDAGHIFRFMSDRCKRCKTWCGSYI
jgi:hypothetical protein